MENIDLTPLSQTEFSKIIGRKWRNLTNEDIFKISWFNELEELHFKHVLVSGESFAVHGKEGTEEFQTENIIAEPAGNEISNPKVVLISSNDNKNLALLTGDAGKNNRFIKNLITIPGISLFTAFSKV